MSEQPYMQLWIADYLGDTLHLTAEQHGAYMLLLMAMWRNGGTLPSDPEKLSRIARIPLERWQRVLPDVLAFFDEANGWLSQKRLLAELAKARSKSASRSEAGKAGAEAKALKNNKPLKAIEQAKAKANGHAKVQHSPLPEPLDTPNGVSNAREAIKEFSETFWPAYPHKVGKGGALKAYLVARRKASTPEILDGLQRYVAAKPPDRPWCNPATFLNQERWLDQPAPVATGPPGIRSFSEQRESERVEAIEAMKRRAGEYDPH